jgi:ankyrin repeat protein
MASRLTRRHAAASYAHLELLDYLLSVGGDINVVDDEGETPLFTVETMEAAQYLIAHGADAQWKNSDGQEVSPRPLYGFAMSIPAHS